MPLAQLRQLRQALLPANKFYAPRLAHDFQSLEEFAQHVPFTTKQELVADQLAHPPFGTWHTEPIANYTRFCQTSSTTGNPLRWLDTPASWNWMCNCWQRVYESAGVKPGTRIFFAFSFGPFLGFWTAFDAATRMGCLAIPGGSVPGTRALLERLWPGTRIVDHHGMTETGPVSYECPQRKGVLHIMEQYFYAEIVDPHTGTPLPAGARGELVLTNLGRTAAPVIRYRTGDIVQPDTNPCPCGSKELALVGGILARRDDMVVIRGVNVYPSAIEDVIRACGGVAEYRAEITTVRAMTEISLKIEPETPTAEDLAHRLESGLRDALGLRIPTEIVEPGTLPRFEMKARRWVRL